jgi:hypothetical protein
VRRADDFRDDERDFFGGTFFPARRASERPMAMACLRLWTFLPVLPDRSVPCLRSCIALPTFRDAPVPYFRPLLLRVAMKTSNGTVCGATPETTRPEDRLEQPAYRR